MFTRIFILFFLPLSACSFSINDLSGNFTGKVVGIKDGDTFEIMLDGKAETIRLAHIDCPEKSQPYGKKAKQFASDLCFGKEVIVISSERDRYKRLIGIVYLKDGTNVNKELVKAGLAWHYLQYSNDPTYSLSESIARKDKKGLWVEKNAIAPWEWRKLKRKPKKTEIY